jgi:DHA1 family multidrug resistance protein-like MFS transporter
MGSVAIYAMGTFSDKADKFQIYYSFFESFPFVYVDEYGFSLGELGLAFLSIVIAMLLQTPIYLLYLRWQATRLKAKGFGAQEERLIPALLGCLLPPIGLFIFAWTSDGRIHWIVSLIGVTVYNMGFFVVFQCIFIYLPLSYPQYAASLMAGNGLGRSLLGAGAILFSRPLFLNLGIARGVTVLAGLTVGCTFGMYALWYWGASLRARSRFTAT